MANTSTNQVTNQAAQQFQSMFLGPLRSYAELSLDYSEKLLTIQQEAFRAYSDIALGQARAMLEIKSVEDLRAYTESQQKAVKDVSERIKEDSEKVVNINQEFFQKGQDLAKEKAEEGQKLAERNVEKAQDEASAATDNKSTDNNKSSNSNTSSNSNSNSNSNTSSSKSK